MTTIKPDYRNIDTLQKFIEEEVFYGDKETDIIKSVSELVLLLAYRTFTSRKHQDEPIHVLENNILTNLLDIHKVKLLHKEEKNKITKNLLSRKLEKLYIDSVDIQKLYTTTSTELTNINDAINKLQKIVNTFTTTNSMSNSIVSYSSDCSTTESK